MLFRESSVRTLVLGVLVIVAACGRGEEVEPAAVVAGEVEVSESDLLSKASEQAVRAHVASFVEAYHQRNVAASLGHFTTSPIPSAFGTNSDERRVGIAEIRQQIEKDFALTRSLTFAWSFTLAGASLNAGWVAYEGTANIAPADGSEPFVIPVRLSATLLRSLHGWRFVQMHLSVPQPPGI